MRITNVTQAARAANRANVFVDGKYRFSLDVFQIGELGIKIGKQFSEAELSQLETESEFGKLYARALEYTMLRPHSSREIWDYLRKKTRETKYKSRKTGEIQSRAGVSEATIERVYARLNEKGYLNDEKFARFWIDNRNVKKGTSIRRLQAELMIKGVDRQIVDRLLTESTRSDQDELSKIIEKKARKYPDQQKFMAYLARQGFSYDDIKSALSSDQQY